MSEYQASRPAARAAIDARYYDRNRGTIRARQNAPGYVPLPERIVEAGNLLVDGAGYAEAARSTGVSRSILVDLLRGLGMTPQERGGLGRAVMLARTRGDAALMHELRDAA